MGHSENSAEERPADSSVYCFWRTSFVGNQYIASSGDVYDVGQPLCVQQFRKAAGRQSGYHIVRTDGVTAACRYLRVIIQSNSVLSRVIEQLGLSISEEKLRERIDVTTVNDTEVISVSVSDTSPKQAQDIANTIADVLPDEFERVVKAGGVEVVDYAEEPDKPSSPNVLLNTFAGVLAGFLISCGVVFLREFFDTRIRDEEGLSEYFNYEIPVLGVIPSLEETAEDRNPKRSRQRNEKR